MAAPPPDGEQVLDEASVVMVVGVGVELLADNRQLVSEALRGPQLMVMSFWLLLHNCW